MMFADFFGDFFGGIKKTDKKNVTRISSFCGYVFVVVVSWVVVAFHISCTSPQPKLQRQFCSSCINTSSIFLNIIKEP